MKERKVKKEKILGHRKITDEDVEIFKEKNNLKTDRDAISFLINKLAISGGQS